MVNSRIRIPAIVLAGIMLMAAGTGCDSRKIRKKDQLLAVHQVIERYVAGADAAVPKYQVHLDLPKKDGCDQYTVGVDKKGELQICASGPVAACRAFYDYVRRNGYGICSWTGNRLQLPSVLQPENFRHVESPFQHHYYFNVVTFGYSMPYWTWNEWEKEIDWMALHGMDMPLALVANEAISARVWKKLGLTDEEILRYFVGPAHLPWMRMGCISGVDSPLPESWLEGQVELQHKILHRMRELGMKPICPGFSGFLPKEILRIYPDARLVETSWSDFHNWLLMTEDPLFLKIGKMFIEEWENEFGKGDYYLVDSFNEMSVPFPPHGNPERYEKLAEYGQNVYESIRQANDDAVWVIQGWMFGYQRDIWDYKSYSALFSKIPDDKVLILDMAEDYNYNFWHNQANWEFFKGFDNKQWIYSTIPNMGGKTALTGILEFYANGGRLDVMSSPNKGNLVGFGTATEGIENNEVIYELISDAGWTADGLNLKEWLDNYTLCRYGKNDGHIGDYWNGITRSVYGHFTDHPRYIWQLRPGIARKGSYQIDSLFFDSIEQFAKAAPEMKGSQLYATDLVDLAAQYAGGKMELLLRGVDKYSGTTDSVAALFTELASGTDRVLSAHPVYDLQRWIDLARSHGTTPEEADYYEHNAKRIVTVWGPPVDDYSARIWSGLIRDYYQPRCEAFFRSLKDGKPFDYAGWEADWVQNSRGLSPVDKPADRVQAALDLIELAKTVPIN